MKKPELANLFEELKISYNRVENQYKTVIKANQLLLEQINLEIK
jgi:hypothetical protein